MTGRIIFWLLLALAIILSLKFYTKYLEQKLVFIPNKILDLVPFEINPSWEDIYFKTDDGIEINGWFCPSHSGNYTVLFFNGNAANIGDHVSFLQSLNEIGFSCFVIDYRGYGKSKGSPSEKGIYFDAKGAYDYLTQQRGMRAERLILWGTSLGGAPATYLASTKKCGAIILFSAFTNASDMASRIIPFFPLMKPFMSIKYDNLERLKAIDIPVLIIHAKNDDITPYWMGEKLFDTANEPKKFLSLSSSDHAIINEEDSTILWNCVKDFVKELPQGKYDK